MTTTTAANKANAAQPADKYDAGVFVADIQKNAMDVVRVRLTKFKNYDLLDIRQFYTDKADELQPTGKGLSIRQEQIPELLAALQKAADMVDVQDQAE